MAETTVTRCSACALRRREIFRAFGQEELKFVASFKSGELVIDAGSTLLMEGSNSPQLFTALRGMGLRYKMLPDGRRQVVNFVMPGDFVGLQAGVMGEMKHSVEATTAMTLCVFNRAEIWTLFKSHPGLAYDLTWLAAVEEHFLGETVATLGQRSATERIAWAFVKFYSRADALGLVAHRTVPFPYRQQDLADALGLSLVHTNKTLKRLAERQLVSLKDNTLTVPDLERLAEVAGMDETSTEKRPLI